MFHVDATFRYFKVPTQSSQEYPVGREELKCKKGKALNKRDGVVITRSADVHRKSGRLHVLKAHKTDKGRR